MLAKIVNLSKVRIVQFLFVGQRFFKSGFELLFAYLFKRPTQTLRKTKKDAKGDYSLFLKWFYLRAFSTLRAFALNPYNL